MIWWTLHNDIFGGGGEGWENFVKEEGGRGGGQYFD